jgi:hypothetical protein
MKKVLWKFSGLVIFTSTVIVLMAGLLTAPQFALRIRKSQQQGYGAIKERAKT